MTSFQVLFLDPLWQRRWICIEGVFFFFPKKNPRLAIHPGKINMEPENASLEKENHLPNHHFQVLCLSSGGVTSVFGWWFSNTKLGRMFCVFFSTIFLVRLDSIIQNLLQSISSVFFKIDVNSAHVYFFFLYEFTISGSLDQIFFNAIFVKENQTLHRTPEQLWQ